MIQMLHLEIERLLQNKEEWQGQIEATTLAIRNRNLELKKGLYKLF